MGDSITQGVGDENSTGGYRQRLIAQYPKFTSVGPYNLPTLSSNVTNHGGLAGEGALALLTNISTIYTPYLADIVLLMIGTNDMGPGWVSGDNELCAGRVASIVDAIHAAKAACKVIVMPPINARSDQTGYNSHLPVLAPLIISAVAGKPNTTIATTPFLLDSEFDAFPLHPNYLGYQKLVTAWSNAIASLGY